MSAEAIINYIFASIGLAIAAAFTYLGRAKANTGQVEAATNRENVVTVFATTFEARSNAQQEQLFKLNGEFNREKGRHEESEKTSASRILTLETQVSEMETTQQTQKKESDASSVAYEKRISELEAEQKRLNEVIALRDETIAKQDETITELKSQVKSLSESVEKFIATQAGLPPTPITEVNNAAQSAESKPT